MVRNNQGLTAIYNRFHDPEEEDPEIQKLRDLHDAMDRAVLDAYGWTDLRPTCTFLLDDEDDGIDEETAGKARKKKPWRYRFPDDVRDEVLARLLALNQERAAEEKAAAPMAEAGKGASKKKGRGGMARFCAGEGSEDTGGHEEVLRAGALGVGRDGGGWVLGRP
ncbi:hypothetical protein [Polyangium mundeleinium]|uniref:Uncharacterized protein n=1 Tax=Polyangium mundeleinium TaxID=2995306 RepID=A0ABT5F494_9BACT|nr:hypothetical protein [Polyangium mundeleinium]MDC0748926.1 hypothetical protein [Polyangium mundeleinium]